MAGTIASGRENSRGMRHRAAGWPSRRGRFWTGYRNRSCWGWACWTAAALIGAAALGDAPPYLLAAVNALAAGALLTMIADTMIPEAVEGERGETGLLVTLGFLVAFALSHLGAAA